MRLPKFFDRGSLRRIVIGIGVVFVLFGLFYAWQPQRFDLVEHAPEKPLARIPIERTGLFETGK
ncbi:MAG TPA: hypothetical protein PLX06_10035, partial [Fimbriimonadaceae bacterium]|nr:hypothetical protein [Fimbriimonadaceae bacterium]